MANNAIKKFLSTIGFEPIDGDSTYLDEPQDDEASSEVSYREERMERRERRDRSDRAERLERNERRSPYIDEDDAPVAFNRSNTQNQSMSSMAKRAQNNVISMPERSNTQINQEKMVMRIVCPTSFEDTRVVIDNLRANKAIVLNIDEIDVKIAQRILDFVSGAIYSLDGDIKKVSRNIYVVAPEGVSVSTGLTDGNQYTSEVVTDNDNYYN